MNDKQFNKAREERRFKILWVSMDRMMRLLTSGHIKETSYILDKIKLKVPHRVLEVFYSPSRRAFGFTVISSKFDKVELGNEFVTLTENEAVEVEVSIKTARLNKIVDKKTMEALA